MAELRNNLEATQLWRRCDSVRALVGVVKHGDAKHSDIIAAVKELNLMHGYNEPVKIEHSGAIDFAVAPVISPEDWMRAHGVAA